MTFPSRSLLPLSAVVAAAICVAFAQGCSRTSAASDRPSPINIPPAVQSTTVPAASASVSDPPEIAGDLRPAQSANLSFKVGGKIASVAVTRGQLVAKGQVLATLSDAEARATVAQAEAAVRGAEAQAAIAQDTETRVKGLASADAVPANTLVGATNAAQAALAGVAQARAALQLARANQANHVLTAPFRGVAVSVPDGIGTTVGPGTPVIRVEQLDMLVLHASIGERDVSSLSVGDSLQVMPAVGAPTTGKVRAIVGSLDPVSRRAPVEIEVPNASGSLLAGSYVRAFIPGHSLSQSDQ